MSETTTINEKGHHKDDGKTPFDQLDPSAMEGLAKVMAFGAGKYGRNNWRGGIRYTRIIGSLLRHIFAILRCEDIDPESLLPHIDHVMCNAMFLSYYMKHKPDMDDRYKNDNHS